MSDTLKEAQKLTTALKRLDKQEATTIENTRKRYAEKRKTLLANVPAEVRRVLDAANGETPNVEGG